LGPDHPINRLPTDIAGDEAQGTGSYTVGVLGLSWLFRPTSIFLHFGKYGQVAFVLATYSAFYRAGAIRVGTKWLSLWLLEVVVLVLSGQRAAMLLYAVALVVLFLFYGHRARIVAFMCFSALALATIDLAVPSDTRSGVIALARLVSLRVLSGFHDVPERLSNNVIQPIAYAAGRWAMVGEGLGAFSVGSSAFGGRPLYEAIPAGTAENSWLRIMAEQGLPGLIAYAMTWGTLLLLALYRWSQWRGWSSPGRGRDLGGCILLFVIFELVALASWANTHDVLGNVTTMAVAMGFVGVICLGFRRRPARASIQGPF
jgi:hypothetical protein